MWGLVMAVALATMAGSSVFAQSHDPAIGTGNIASSPFTGLELSPGERRGLIFVKANCAQCHAVDQFGASPLATAAPLRDLNVRYPVADLQRPLAEGIPRMPRFQLTAGQLADVMAYLKALKR
jgi:mono/diheme cytochrome c family protein